MNPPMTQPQMTTPPMPGQPAQQNSVATLDDDKKAGVVTGLKHRPTNRIMPFNPDMAESEDMVGVDDFGNEVFNTPFSGSALNPNAPPAPPIMGYVTKEEHDALLARISRLENEQVRLGQLVHTMQNPHLQKTG